MNKRGQVTIFVIIGIVLIIAGILIYSFIPNLKTTKTTVDENPKLFIKNCLEDDFQMLVQQISLNGGKLVPEFYHPYYGNDVQMLCSVATYYELCVIQDPHLKESVELELKKGIENKLGYCFVELVSSLKNKGYIVELKEENFSVELIPKRIFMDINNTLTISKTDSRIFDDFDLYFESNLYEILEISQSIIEFESLIGDADPIKFMSIYGDFEINKTRAHNEVKIYVIKDKKTNEIFQFASRSLVFPPGLI